MSSATRISFTPKQTAELIEATKSIRRLFITALQNEQQAGDLVESAAAYRAMLMLQQKLTEKRGS